MNSSGDLKFWGIDGCPCGWFCVGLGADDSWDCFLAKDIGEAHEKLRRCNAKIALIDIPIGLPSSKGGRECDKAARKFVGGRSSSVFSVPCRQAVEAYRNASGDKSAKEKAGKSASKRVTGGPMSAQTWGIVPKIAEVDSFLCENEGVKNFFREMHPEVCFRAFSKESLGHSKKKPQGFAERMAILSKHLPNAKEIFDGIRNCHRYGVGKDDILDALVGALTAKLGYKILPPNPPQDSRGLPMQMLYFCKRQN